MSKKQLYSIIVSIFIIVVLIIYWKFAFKTISTNYPIKKAEKKATTSKTTNQTEKKVSHNSKANFFSLREYKNFFEDVPCKESFIIYNYLSELFNDPKVREQTHQKIAVKLAKDGYLDKAIDFAMQIDDQNIRDETLSKIVNELTKTGAIEKALDISNSIQGEPEKSKAIQYIADFLIDKGDLEKASSLTEKMQDSEEPWNPKTKSESIAKIAKKIFDTSTFDEAMKIANSIPDWETQVETIRYFAKEFMEDGERQTAEDIYKKAIELVDSIEIKNKFWNEQLTKYDILNEIAIDLKHAGFKEWSDSIFQRVMKSIE
ncbi:hypothetical protein KKB18_04440, partial [bacterium]|nr:hypothetical protein [bacterium]